MSKTKLRLKDVQKTVAHVTDISEEGWHLSWGESLPFELLYKGENIQQAKILDEMLTNAYTTAEEKFSNELLS